MKVDTASEKILSHTDQAWTKFVRFYFRPRTPTQHQCEGFRPLGQYGSLGAHCPMPFVFMFDAADILTRTDTRFSNGNLSSVGIEVGDTAEFFCALPFEHIYHARSLTDPQTKQAIITHRCAEVLVPDGIGLGTDVRVWCRSPAEYETLLNNLVPQIRRKFKNRIGHGAQLETHFRFWSYIESATLEWNRLTLRFSPSSIKSGPFRIVVSITSPMYGILEWTSETFDTVKETPFVLKISQHVKNVEYDVRVTLDNNEAYYGQYRPESSSPGVVS